MRLKGLAGYNLDGLRRLLRCARIGLAMRPDTIHRTGERIGGAGSDEQLTAKLAAIWNELARRGEMERVMEDEREEDENPEPGTGNREAAADADNVLGMCNVEGCTGDALRDGICKRHLLKLAMGGDPEAAEAVRKWHAVHDRQPETPRVPSWRKYPDAERPEKPERGTRPQDPLRENTEQGKAAETATTTEDGEQVRSSGPEACSLKPEACPPSQENTMGKSKRVKCEKCGRQIGAQAFKRHVAACKGPEPTTFPCPVCKKGHLSQRALHCHQAHTGHGDKDGSRGKQPQKRKYTKRAKTNQTAGAQVRINLPLPAAIRNLPAGEAGPQSTPDARSGRNQEPPDGIAAAGHALLRLVELLGLSGQISDCQHPDGHLFINTAAATAVIVAPNGDVLAAGPVLGWSKL